METTMTVTTVVVTETYNMKVRRRSIKYGHESLETFIDLIINDFIKYEMRI